VKRTGSEGRGTSCHASNRRRRACSPVFTFHSIIEEGWINEYLVNDYLVGEKKVPSCPVPSGALRLMPDVAPPNTWYERM